MGKSHLWFLCLRILWEAYVVRHRHPLNLCSMSRKILEELVNDRLFDHQEKWVLQISCQAFCHSSFIQPLNFRLAVSKTLSTYLPLHFIFNIKYLFCWSKQLIHTSYSNSSEFKQLRWIQSNTVTAFI